MDIIKKAISEFVCRMPVKTIGFLIVGWLILVVLYILFFKFGLFSWDLQYWPYWFPLSVFSGPSIHLAGIPYLLCFLIVLVLAVRLAPRLNSYQVWLAGFILIILGNLGQGSWDDAFYKPFYLSGVQYAHDAIKITSWVDWLSAFNVNQPTLLVHSKTHPPFAVLLHYLLLNISGGGLLLLSMTFVFISSLSIALVWNIFRVLQVPLEERNLLALLFSVIPAVNIYTAVSLDGVILTGATLFLYGMTIILKAERMSARGLLAMTVGGVITNLLTYGGIFLIAVAGIQAGKQYFLNRKFDMAIALLITIEVFAAVAITLYLMYGYNHIQGFITASALENPEGFRGWLEPANYLGTRVVDLAEICFFMSFGLLAMLLHPQKLKISYADWRSVEVGTFLSGLIILLAMFASGAYPVGETARAALFIYPYIALTLINAGPVILKDLLVMAGLQTFVMQLFGNYFW